jgi:hypothetical protein
MVHCARSHRSTAMPSSQQGMRGLVVNIQRRSTLLGDTAGEPSFTTTASTDRGAGARVTQLHRKINRMLSGGLPMVWVHRSQFRTKATVRCLASSLL